MLPDIEQRQYQGSNNPAIEEQASLDPNEQKTTILEQSKIGDDQTAMKRSDSRNQIGPQGKREGDWRYSPPEGLEISDGEKKVNGWRKGKSKEGCRERMSRLGGK